MFGRIAIVVSIGASLTLSGCGNVEPLRGTVIEKDYDAASSKKSKQCKTKTVSGKRKRVCRTVTKREAADWDITVRDSKGVEHEIEVSKREYNSIQIGDTYNANR